MGGVGDVYLDSCIIVKLVSHEPDSPAYHALVAGQPVVTSELAVTEVRSALLTKERIGRISRKDRIIGWNLFLKKVREHEFVLLPLNRAVLERAGGIIEQCHPEIGLRSLDAIHVATAELHGGEEMCSNDGRVRAASNELGLLLTSEPK
jgi:predicted nucleic acid-binding protein